MRAISDEHASIIKSATAAAYEALGGVSRAAEALGVASSTLTKYASTGEEWRDSFIRIEGGMRTHKAFERQLIDRGLMKRGDVAVPAKRAPLDRYGNMTQGFLNRVMADLQIDYRGAGATRTRTSSSLKRNKNYKNARFFVPKQPSHLHPGVYQRDPATNAIHPVILFVPQVSYRIRLRLREVVERYVIANVHDHFAVAFQRAVRMAR
ncbi:hypothetical protein GOD78_26615 [Sinorhizobium medicae]|nr:hypothetical protein [Sinorhizobium medicae]MDX0821014.1 hypothetical protein [Sinorhizobium medicae]MDX0864022.1 hypothetical protein [Sinorhizobium medicae]